jgi:ring-1,2-phenylacetyl-CoA epoxidase subunit PaaD
MPALADVHAALAEVPDPELPVLSVVDLGIVHRLEIDTGGIRVAILPTFVGCPALDVIRSSIVARLATFGVPVRVDTTFEVPWTSDRISPAGRRALASVGIAPPDAPDAVRCPFCASASVVMDSAFGPTQCRSLFYCRACRQPFEALKAV